MHRYREAQCPTVIRIVFDFLALFEAEVVGFWTGE
jgi:hypothetical protein